MSVSAGQVVGFVEPYKIVNVAFPETGVIAELHVTEGDVTKKGEVLAVLDYRELRSSLAIAKARKDATAQLDAARIDQAQKQNRHEQLKALQHTGSARDDEVAKALAEQEIAAAEVRAAKERIHIAELEYDRILTQIERRKLRSPIDGVVTQIDKEVGELVAGGESSVIQIAQLDRLQVVLHVGEETLSTISAGQIISLHLPSRGVKVPGTVEFVSPLVDAKSGTVKIKVTLENRDGSIRSGLRAALVVRESVQQAADSTSAITLTPIEGAD
ncbi:MAG: efflux RND transporter periplasmic adaptor subunit [Gammaproteobacteria bacterium]|nr:efflux RND transporter periplasmic adaptor subunit [Gammaproteobacteria bacterium]